MYAATAQSNMRQDMTLSDNMFQPGVILHEVIAGALKAKGTNFDTWCSANGINRSTARQATYGQSGGDRGKHLLERMINDAGRDVVTLSYRTRIEAEAKRLEGAAA
jgi:hypothetical protein